MTSFSEPVEVTRKCSNCRPPAIDEAVRISRSGELVEISATQRAKFRILLPAAFSLVCILPRTPVHAQAAQDLQATPSETIEVNAKGASHPFPHYWERMFGSGRAILSLRDSYRHDLREVKQATAFEYIRFHAIFHDEVGLYDEDAQGQEQLNFSYVDQIYDGLLAAGVR